MIWKPILHGPLRDRALVAAWAIADELVELGHDASVAGGSAGLAVLYAYLDRTRPGRGYNLLSNTYMAQALKSETAPSVSPSLFRGATGVAWAAAHLRRETVLTGAVDRALAGLLDRRHPPGDFSLADGLVGYGVYALERLGQLEAEVILERVVDRLNVGPARGLPGAVPLLAAAVQLNVNARKARDLLDGAVCRLPAQQLNPGIAAALLLAARAVGEPEWEREALAAARTAAGRPPAEARVSDAGLCQGAAGLAHIFNRLHQMTGDRELGLSARFWIEQTLALPRPTGNGLLRGAAGVALALLAAATDVEPAWDRLFLLSYRLHLFCKVPGGLQP